MEETLHTDSIRFLYHEMTSLEARHFAQNLQNNRSAKAEFGTLLEAKMNLPKAQFMPDDATIDSILKYSAKTANQPAH
jgi:hypothetical protein